MMNLSSVFLIFTGLLAELFALQAVSLKGTAVLPCYRTQNTPAEQQDVIWRIAEGQLVAQWSRGRFTAGPGYEGRVQLFAKEMEDGNFSLAISPVEYNDKGSYDCYTGFDHLAVVELGVSVSTDRNITAQVGDPVTLPCYANVSKQANLSHLNIRWEKDGQTVLDIQSGTGSGFENRVSLSPDRVLVGDLSLTISAVLFSDRGAYRCFFSNDIGTPEGIILSIAGRQSNITIQPSESLFLPLHTKEPVHVLFCSGGCTSVSVCTVEGDSVDCGPQYQHRASVHNSTLMLEYTTPADSGVYRVMDKRTKDIINTVFVSVTLPLTVLFLFLSVLLLLGALLLLWMTVQEFKKKKIKLKYKLYLLFLVVMLLLNLVLVAVSGIVIAKPGHKELYVALGVGLGLFLVFKMVIMSMTCEKLAKIRKEKTVGYTEAGFAGVAVASDAVGAFSDNDDVAAAEVAKLDPIPSAGSVRDLARDDNI